MLEGGWRGTAADGHAVLANVWHRISDDRGENRRQDFQSPGKLARKREILSRDPPRAGYARGESLLLSPDDVPVLADPARSDPSSAHDLEHLSFA